MDKPHRRYGAPPLFLIPSNPTRKDPPMNIKEETRKMKLASPILAAASLEKDRKSVV